MFQKTFLQLVQLAKSNIHRENVTAVHGGDIV